MNSTAVYLIMHKYPSYLYVAFLVEVQPVDVPTEFLQNRVIPVHLEIEDLPIEVIETVTTETPTETTVEIKQVRRTVTATEVQIEEIPTEEMMEFVIDETSPIPSEIVIEIQLETLPETLSTRTVTAPKAKKPTSPWEAPEDLEIVFETMQETQKPVTELVKPEESVTEEIEVLPTKATSTVQLALYETPKPTVTMTFKLPERLEKEGTHLFLRKRITCFF